MIELFKLDHSLSFPAHQLALDEPNGLLAFGGDLSPERLLHAYNNGIFPWYSLGEPILWWTPNPRGVLLVDDFSPSRSLRKSVRKYQYTATMDYAFERVIDACAQVPRDVETLSNPNNTWITEEMLHAYIDLHYMGHAHSVEVWNGDGDLVGGLYGIGLNSIFCGESMFHIQTDASKAALWALVAHMKAQNLPLIDCQMTNPHLASLGCKTIPRDEFLPVLKSLVNKSVENDVWTRRELDLK
ncbi:leucyl/phenylalanyl-tRNA--protein transferase [Glaciecola sp. 1036]|uniref:leucyl/phenylalanyl-tRNA--protein transferase n=1 Tax=Alteromonadaceae TaxID=72275 RepID=UPI003CFBD465